MLADDPPYMTPRLERWRRYTDGPLLIVAVASLPILLLELERSELPSVDRVLIDVVNVVVLVAFAIDYASAGASTRELMSRLGHTSPAAALRYQHATAERDRAIADRMDDLIAGRSERPALRVLKGAG